MQPQSQCGVFIYASQEKTNIHILIHTMSGIPEDIIEEKEIAIDYGIGSHGKFVPGSMEG